MKKLNSYSVTSQYYNPEIYPPEMIKRKLEDFEAGKKACKDNLPFDESKSLDWKDGYYKWLNHLHVNEKKYYHSDGRRKTRGELEDDYVESQV